jgi:hypothetical protein
VLCELTGVAGGLAGAQADRLAGGLPVGLSGGRAIIGLLLASEGLRVYLTTPLGLAGVRALFAS